MTATPASFPVSVKGVAVRDGRVLLLRNERSEWELPGGRIERGESPEECLVREVAEETGWRVRAGPILDSWIYHIAAVDRSVFVVTYGCHPDDCGDPVTSHEHNDIGLFSPAEAADLHMPDGYKHSIGRWFTMLSGDSNRDRS